VRIVTRSAERRVEIEALGAECFLGDPNRLGTLRGALESVTVVCWLLGDARGEPRQLRELHESRLPAFLAQAVDSPLRGFVYEAAVDDAGAEGARLVRGVAARNAIAATALTADRRDTDLWLKAARATLSPFL
jgi:uncharacterized protein YbjT (DUF2867 family)